MVKIVWTEFEFFDVWTNDAEWLENVTFDDFKKWFEYYVSTIVVDLDE